MAENDQHLKHGKALCGKVFGRFVETFNALVDFMLGIKGDADGKNGEGHITYDRKNNIIRCSGCSGSSSDDSSLVSGGCFALDGTKLVNCYFNVGGVTNHMPDTDIAGKLGGVVFVCLLISENNPSITTVNDTETLRSLQEDASKYVIPLYLFSESVVIADIRNAPHVQQYEPI